MKQFRFNRCTSRKGFEISCTISFFGGSLANGCMGKVTDNNQREPSFFSRTSMAVECFVTYVHRGTQLGSNLKPLKHVFSRSEFISTKPTAFKKGTSDWL